MSFLASQILDRPLKSILKPTPPTPQRDLLPQPTTESIILTEHQRRLHALNIIESLTTTSSSIVLFKSQVAQLTPAEFDDLIQERNIEHRCGYPLCSRPPRQYARGQTFKIHKGEVQETADLGRWCSDVCTRRAYNVKLQLGDRLLIGRDGRPIIELLEEEEEEGNEKGRRYERMGWTKSDAVTAANAVGIQGFTQKATDVAAALQKDRDMALERGKDMKRWQFEVTIREKAVAPGAKPIPRPGFDEHLKVEGYKTTLGGKASNINEDEDEELDGIL